MINKKLSAGLLAMACLCAMPQVYADNAVTNPGFEAGPEWAITAAAGEENPVFVDNTVSHTGKASLCIRHKSAESYSRAACTVMLKPDTEYTASVWIKMAKVVPSAKGDSCAARLYVCNDSGGELGVSPLAQGTSGWKQVSVTFNSGKCTTVPVLLYLHNASGTVWFDDVEIVEGKPVPVKQQLTSSNIAQGRKYTMSKKPNYALCTDGKEDKKLTDGIFAGDGLWTDKATVGWQDAGTVEIIVDLGAVEPIHEIAISVQGGARGNVSFPDAAFFVSEDGEKFYYTGSRFDSNMEDKGGRYGAAYHLNDLATKGRYVAIALVNNGPFIFADEIEVARGAFPVSTVTLQGTVCSKGSLADAIKNMRTGVREISSLRREIAPMKAALTGSAPELLKEFVAIDKELERSDLNQQAREAVRVRAGILNARIAQAVHPGKTKLVYADPQWQDFGVFDIPAAGTNEVKSLSLTMGNDEYESASFIVFNMMTTPCAGNISISDLKGKNGVIPARDITLRYGEWVECNDGLMRPDALPLVDGAVQTAPGTNRAFWVTVKGNHVPAGEYTGTITLNDGKETDKIALNATVLPVSLPQPVPVSTYNWAYLNFAPTKADPEAAVADLAAHYIDTAVIHPADLPKFAFDQQGNITAKDYAAFDADVKLHQKAGIKKFMLFCSFGDGGSKTTGKPFGACSETTFIPINTPEWKNAMRNLVADWVAHLKQLGVNYNEFSFYPLDEAGDKFMDNGGKDVLAMFKAADPKAQIFVNPTANNTVAGMKKIAPYVDIWCPHMVQTLDRELLDFYASEQRAGKQIQSYNCAGPDKTFSPLGHYRRMLWQAWAYGMTGAAHWSYADTGWRASSGLSAWTDFDGCRNDYSIIYDAATAPAHVTKKEAQIPSRRWEAWRDGVEDYAYLWMLRQAVEKAKQAGNNSGAVTHAESVLKSSVAAVLDNPSDINVYRTARRSVLEAIAELNK